MKVRRRREGRGRGYSPWFALFAVACFTLFAVVAFSTFRLFGVSFRPVLISTWQNSAMNAVSATDHPFLGQDANTSNTTSPPLEIQEAILLPDQVLLFLKPSSPFPTADLRCLYHPPSSTSSSSSPPNFHLPSISANTSSPVVRCPLPPRDFSVSLSSSPSPPVRPHPWDRLAYVALFDPRDNSTLLFAKGLNLRPARLSYPSRYECVFGWEFKNPKYLLTAPAVSAAQEIVRCKTPISVIFRHLRRPPLPGGDPPPLVSIRAKGRRGGGGTPLPSAARPVALPLPPSRRRKAHSMCVCTMVRNPARFLREWIAYHARVGVERWFIYDNNSDDDTEQVIHSMASSSPGYKITRHLWPWVKTQEAGFAHCALLAREQCEWVGFIDVDEFLHFPSDATLRDVLRNYSAAPAVGEIRTACHTFGPSGRKAVPPEGVTAGYTCRMNAPERHKSIVRPEALHPSLINIVHHFHLKDGMGFVDVDRGVMVINHYKYQVWEVFKEKFYRRVATYVTDWQDEENVGSKDRAPGLGTKAVEPPDWPTRFCEVNDTGLRDWVLQAFADPKTGLLPW